MSVEELEFILADLREKLYYAEGESQEYPKDAKLKAKVAELKKKIELLTKQIQDLRTYILTHPILLLAGTEYITSPFDPHTTHGDLRVTMQPKFPPAVMHITPSFNKGPNGNLPFDPPAYRISMNIEGLITHYMNGNPRAEYGPVVADQPILPWTPLDKEQMPPSEGELPKSAIRSIDLSWRFFDVVARKPTVPVVGLSYYIQNIANGKWLCKRGTDLATVRASAPLAFKIIESKTDDPQQITDPLDPPPPPEDEFVKRNINYDLSMEPERSLAKELNFTRPDLDYTMQIGASKYSDLRYMRENYTEWTRHDGTIGSWDWFWENLRSFIGREPNPIWLAGMAFLRRRLKVLGIAKSVRPRVTPQNVRKWYNLLEPAMCLFHGDPYEQDWKDCLSLALGYQYSKLDSQEPQPAEDYLNAAQVAKEFINGVLSHQTEVDEGQKQVMRGLLGFFHVDDVFSFLTTTVSTGLYIAAGVAAYMILRK